MDLYRWLRNQWDRTLAVGLTLVGIVAVYLGWRGIAHAELPAEQIPYLASGAVVGIFALGIAATLWLSADLRDEWRKLDDLHRAQLAEDESAPHRELNGHAVGHDAEEGRARPSNGRLKAGARTEAR